jgi:hypothetical protein
MHITWLEEASLTPNYPKLLRKTVFLFSIFLHKKKIFPRLVVYISTPLNETNRNITMFYFYSDQE